MMSKTLGAPFGGTTRAGQYGFDPAVVRSILPPNFCGGGGSCVPSMTVVAAGEPARGAAFGCALPGYRGRPVHNAAATPKTGTPRNRIWVRKGQTPLLRPG